MYSRVEGLGNSVTELRDKNVTERLPADRHSEQEDTYD